MSGPGGEGSCPPLAPGGPPAVDPGSYGFVRWIATLVLALAVAGLVVLAVRSWEERARRAGFRPPFSAEGAEAVSVDGSVWRADRTLRRPTVIIYVRWSCPHCADELRRWEALRTEDVPGPDLDVRVVAPEPPPSRSALPTGLHRRVLQDRKGSTARALGADLVPTTAYVAPGGTVVALTRGRTSVNRIRRSILRLEELSIDAPVP